MFWKDRRHDHPQEVLRKDRCHDHPQEVLVPLLRLLLDLLEVEAGCQPVSSQKIDTVPELISPPFQGQEIDSVTIVTNHQRDALVTKSTR